jgi:uncharacterized protein YuzE
MKTLQRVTVDTSTGQNVMYLYYAEGSPITRTVDETPNGTVAVDIDAAGETVGVEVQSLGATEIAALSRVATERRLSLDRFFDLAAAAPRHDTLSARGEGTDRPVS